MNVDSILQEIGAMKAKMNKKEKIVKTPEEAIETIKSNMPTSGYQMLRESLIIAIGALEKQIPKKPVCKPKPYNESVGFNEEWFCPSCGAYIGYFYEGMDEPEQMEYCNECGQHIARDWSDESEDE